MELLQHCNTKGCKFVTLHCRLLFLCSRSLLLLLLLLFMRLYVFQHFICESDCSNSDFKIFLFSRFLSVCIFVFSWSTEPTNVRVIQWSLLYFIGGLYSKVTDRHCSLPIPSALAFVFPLFPWQRRDAIAAFHCYFSNDYQSMVISPCHSKKLLSIRYAWKPGDLLCGLPFLCYVFTLPCLCSRCFSVDCCGFGSIFAKGFAVYAAI